MYFSLGLLFSGQYISNASMCVVLITMLASSYNFSWSIRVLHEMIALTRDYLRYWSESQFSSDFLLFLIINMQSSLHASLWKHRNLTRLRYSIIHFLMQNGVNAWINYVSTRDCWFYVPVGRCWSSGTPINTPLTVRAQLSYNRLCTPIKMYRHNYRRLSAGASFPRLLLWFTGGCVL